MPLLSEELAPEITFLERNLSVTKADETYEPSHFGNALLILKGPSYAIRFVRDRGQIFVDVAGTLGKWVDGNRLLEGIGLHPSPGHPLSGKELVPLIYSNFDSIRDFLK